MKREAQILQEVLLAIGSRPDCRVWRSNTGAARGRGGRLIRFGIRGQADILGLTATGRFLAIEVKSATGRLRAEQIAFRDLIQRFNGLYILARSAEDAVSQIENFLCEPAAFPGASFDRHS